MENRITESEHEPSNGQVPAGEEVSNIDNQIPPTDSSNSESSGPTITVGDIEISLNADGSVSMPEEHARRSLLVSQNKRIMACAAEVKAVMDKYGCRFQVVQEWLDGVAQPTEVRIISAR